MFSLKKAYFSGSSSDVEGFSAVMELNAQYAGLPKTGAATTGMQNGQDALTENEMASVQHLLREVNTSLVKSWRQGEQESEAIANAVGSMQSLARFLEEHQNTLERRAGTYSHGSSAAKRLGKILESYFLVNEILEFESENHSSINYFPQEGKFVGFYFKVPVFESSKMGSGGITLPPFGIIVGVGVFNSDDNYDKSLLAHEYGHWLQFQDLGSELYYMIIGTYSSCFALGITSNDWTEIDANNRGYNFLDKPLWWHSDFPLSK
ncbi:MAG: hypothetical protein IM592_01380 [Bacteroidetes bacterium]|nr:hypothetical protein [Bacteroidota bacterium]